MYKFENYLRGLAGIYEKKFKYMKCMGNQQTSLDEGMSYDLRLRQCWVNYMKKYEFNPLHNHSGLYSFVIFVKIPFDLNNEFKSARTRNPNQRYPGCFSFYAKWFRRNCTSCNRSRPKLGTNYYAIPLHNTSSSISFLYK